MGVNLAFIFLLDKYGGTISNPNIPLNALFHILHDFGGTEAGVLIFTWLVYQKGLENVSSTKAKLSYRLPNSRFEE